jgi:hypothetical protein
MYNVNVLIPSHQKESVQCIASPGPACAACDACRCLPVAGQQIPWASTQPLMQADELMVTNPWYTLQRPMPWFLTRHRHPGAYCNTSHTTSALLSQQRWLIGWDSQVTTRKPPQRHTHRYLGRLDTQLPSATLMVMSPCWGWCQGYHHNQKGVVTTYCTSARNTLYAGQWNDLLQGYHCTFCLHQPHSFQVVCAGKQCSAQLNIHSALSACHPSPCIRRLINVLSCRGVCVRSYATRCCKGGTQVQQPQHAQAAGRQCLHTGVDTAHVAAVQNRTAGYAGARCNQHQPCTYQKTAAGLRV